MAKVVMYCFAGRAENMILQMPLYKRILEQYPEVEIDIWKLTKLKRDAEFVERIGGHPRLRVRTDFQRILPWWKRFDHVWRYYTQPQYQDTLFVKLDDDVVFWETDRFGEFLEAARRSPGVISSALTINNGASVAHTPGMQARFNTLDIPLLDVHKSGEFARLAHTYAVTHMDQLLNMPIKAIPTEDWLSINMIAYDWELGCRIADKIGQPAPSTIAGRHFQDGDVIGDEGACNMHRRQIVQGFLAAHLTFGPQELPAHEWDQFRKEYDYRGRLYLGG